MTVSFSDVPAFAAAETLSPVLPGRGADWLTALRSTGLEMARGSGMPTRKSEPFKYSFAALGSMGKLDFVPALIAGDAPVESLPAGLPDIGGHRVVLVNGLWSAALSDHDPLPEGVSLHSLAEVLEQDAASLEGLLGSLMPLENHPFAALATGLLDDGVVLRIAPGTVLDKPLQILSLTATPGNGPVMAQPRLLIDAGADSVATVVEIHRALPGAETLSLVTSEIRLNRGAKLSHVKIRDDQSPSFHVADRQVEIHENATYDAFALSLGGHVAREDIGVSMVGPHGEARLNGAYACRDWQHMDTTICVRHKVPDCTSAQTYKGVLDDHGRGVFQGRVIVERDAQKSDGQQLHRALLLSPTAEVDVKPELTIYADDVTCAHGAACGELDDEAMFYLQSRGLDADAARHLLIGGFLDDVIEKVESEAVREQLSGLVHQWLAAEGLEK